MSHKRVLMLHGALVIPQVLGVKGPARLARILKVSGFDKASIGPFNGWDLYRCRLPTQLVGAYEDAWHPFTTGRFFSMPAWKRLLGREDDRYPLPWDNYVWAGQLQSHMITCQIREFYPQALFTGHRLRENRAVGPYLWEINPGERLDAERILALTDVSFTVDPLHIMDGSHDGFFRITSDPLRFVEDLVQKCPNSIKLIHFHVRASQVPLLFAGRDLGVIGKMLRVLGQGLPDVPVVLEHFPMPFGFVTELNQWLFFSRMRFAMLKVLNG